MSPGFWVLLSLDPYVLLGVRNLEEEKKKKARGGVAISPHPPGFMVLPFGPCVFVSGEKEGALGEGERERGKGPSPGSGTAYLIPPITVIVC